MSMSLRRWQNTAQNSNFRNDTNDNWGKIEGGFNSIHEASQKSSEESTEALKRAKEAENLSKSIKQQLDIIIVEGDSGPEAVQARLDTEGTEHTNLKERIDSDFVKNTEKLRDLSSTVKKLILKPLFVELFATMGRYGIGTPSGLKSYTEGNYVCTINGNAGDRFVTVTSGNISDGGNVWPCVIQDSNLIIYMNQVTGINGNTFTLLDPLPVSIQNGKIGNLHDADKGQHYSQLGYYAFAQYIYRANPRYAERNKNFKQFLGKDVSSFWRLTTTFSKYNNSTNIDNADKTIQLMGSPHLLLNLASPSHCAEFEFKATGKGYIEMFVSSKNPSTLDYLKSGKVVKTVRLNTVLQRVVLDFEDGEEIHVKIYDVNSSSIAVNSLRIGNTTLFINELIKERLIDKNEKIVYIGDSWGTYHNQATTRELKCLMQNEGGSPNVLNFSKNGYTSSYALEWFDEYVIKNKPDTVIIEYFTNDFNSIGGTDVGWFVAPDGSLKNMNINDLTHYESNMKKMITKAIESGIQPIIIMPCVTDSISRTQSVANFTDDLWTGVSEEKSTLAVNQIETTVIKQAGSDGYGNRLKFISTEVNAAGREGHVFDSDKPLTGGSLAVFKNNGETKASLKHDGTFDIQDVQMHAFYGTHSNTYDNRGLIYLFDGGVAGEDDHLRIVIRKGDGSIVTKKIQLID